MLEKIKKYKIVLIILLFFLFLLINNKVNASSKPIIYNDMYFPSEVSINNETVLLYNTNYSWVIGKSYIGNTSQNPLRTFLMINIKYLNNGSNWINCHGMGGSDEKFSINGNYTESFYLYELKNNSWNYVCNSNSRYIQINRSQASYYISNVRVCYNDSSTNLQPTDFSEYNVVLPFNLEYNESLNSYVVYSQWYPITGDNMYSHQHYYQLNSNNSSFEFNFDTKDIDGWSSMEGNDNSIGPGLEYLIENVTAENVDEQLWRVGLQISGYGTYYFCHYLPLSDNKDYEVMKFVFNEDGSCNIYNYDKKTGDWNSSETIENVNFSDFSMHVVYDNYSAIIYSNFFRYDDRYVYTVSYSYDGITYSDDILTEDFGVDVSNDKAGYYRYYKEVSENRTYYFRLQIFDTESNGSLVDTKYLEVVVDGDFYLNSSYNDISYYRKSTVYRILKNKLGILFYPIDITFEFFERLSKVETQNPTITVPTLKEPFTNAVIINGFTFNLNDVLQNNTINSVYNIYLMFVDFIIYGFLFSLLYKVFKEFFDIGGLFNG